MQAVVSEYVHLEKKGGRLWGLCPFHSEKTPSFTVDPDKALFYCFGCQKGGTIFTFIMEMEKLSFVEAVQLLAEKAGVQLEVEEGDRVEPLGSMRVRSMLTSAFQDRVTVRPLVSGAGACDLA